MPSCFSKKFLFCLLALFLIARVGIMAFCSLTDPSEARYAAIGRNMAESGDFLQPRFVHNGKSIVFEGKPPLFFQMSGIACKLFGTSEFSVRLPALIAALLILGFLFYTVRRLRDEQMAVLATSLCMFTCVFFLFAGICMTDLLLAACVDCAIFSYALFASESKRCRKKLYSVSFFAFLGVGMIVKGPVALLMAGLPVFCFVLLNNRWRELKCHSWICGIIAFLVISVPWYWMMSKARPDFLEYFFVNENLKRFLFKEYGDRYGEGREAFHGVAIFWTLICTLPFNLLLALPILSKEKRRCLLTRKQLQDPLAGLSILTIPAITIFWCLTSRVLMTYLLPIMPAFAIYLTIILKKTGFIDDAKFVRTLSRGIVAVALLVSLFSAGAYTFGDCFKDELPGAFFRKLRNHEAFKKHNVYFVRRTPYSAEFYLGKNVRNHAPESVQTSFENSRDCILLFSDYYADNAFPLLEKNPRKLILKYKVWYAFAPEE